MITPVSSAFRDRSPHTSRLVAASAVCLALAGAAGALTLSPSEAQASVVNPYGIVAAQYESGSNPGSVVSGSAYGAYQMSTTNAHAFAQWMQTYKKTSKPYKYGTKLLNAYLKDGGRCGSRFDAAWRALASKYGDSFHRYQYLYIKKTHYTPAVSYLKANLPAFKVSSYSNALKNALFSASVQHGAWGAYKIAAQAFANLKGSSEQLPSEKKLIAEIYKVRAAYKSAKTVKKTIANGAPVYSISSGNTQYYVSNGLLSAKQAKKLKGKALVNFYSSSGATQVGVYYRLTVQENATTLSLLS